MANMTFKANLLPDNTAAQRELGSSTAKWAINGVADPKLTDTLPTINTTGTGNAITAISISGSTITVTKGASYNNYTYTLPTATNGALGGIKIGYTTNNKKYAVQLDTNGKAYVEVPWTDNNTWRGIQDNLTSDSATDSLSAKQGKALANGSARDSTKLPLAGGTMTGAIKRYYSAASTDPVIAIAANNQDATALWMGHGTAAGNPSGNYYKFLYKGTGSSPNNYFQLIAGVNSSSEVIAMQVNEQGNVSFTNTVAADISGNAATASKIGTATVGSSTQPIYLNAGVPTAATSYANATVGTADKLTGFASRAANFTWGNQTGTAITVMNDSSGGSLGFRKDNPASGQMSMVIDGTVYIKEGTVNVGDAIKSITRSGTTFTYTTLWGNTGTFSQQDNNTTYTFANGTAGNFTVTPLGGTAQTVSIGKPATAGVADSANAVAWANVTGKPSSFTPAAHTHLVTEITQGNAAVAGSLDPLTQSLIGSAASNKSFGLPAAAITIEYSTNGGSTWTDYGATDAQKKALFAETRSFNAVLGKATTAAANSVNNQLRITIEPTDRYTSFNGLYIWMSTSGNTVTVDLERSTIGAKNTFTSVFTGQSIAGWSGNNIRYFSYGSFGGGSTQTSNNYKYRLTFKQTAINSNYASASINDIRFLGLNVWSSPNNMVSKNHLYTWNENLDATFPAQITATAFNGNASSASAVKDYNNGTLTTFGYSTSRMTSTSWLGSWDGYKLRAISPANAVKSGVGTTAIGSATKPIYWTGSAFDTITSYEGNAATATKATQDESGNNIKATYASSFSISDHTITLKNKNGASLGTVTVPDNNTWNALSTSQAGYVAKAPNDTTKFLRGDATWAVPPYPVTSVAGKTGAVTLSTLTVGNKTYNGSSNVTIEIADLGLASTTTFLGITSTNLSNGSTTSPVAIVIGPTTGNVSPSNGSVVMEQSSGEEYIWAGSKWNLMGLASSWALANHIHGNILNNGTITSNTAVGNGQHLVVTDSNNKVSRSALTIDTSKTSEFLTHAGTWATPSSDHKVTQNAAITTNGAYPVILATSTATTAQTNTVNKSSTLTYNPSTTKLHTPILEVTSASFGGTLPSSGTTGQVFLQTGAEYYELPAGGTAGQLLAKSSNTDRAVHWVDAPSSSVSPSSAKFYPTGSTSASTNSAAQVFNTSVYVENDVLFGAAWNDYAEYRESTDGQMIGPGRCVVEKGDDTIQMSSGRMEPGASIVSDTYGFAIGKTETANIPIAVTGRVLAFPFENIEEFKKNIGRPVCSGPYGTVSIMTDEEYRNYGYCAIGTISAVPSYKKWGQKNIRVNGRVWIKVR